MTSRAIGLAFLGIATGASFASPARADTDHSRAKLVYHAPDSCPSAEEVSRAVAERLGYEPFRDGAEDTITVTLERTRAKGYRGAIVVTGQGRRKGERALAEDPDCAELVRSASLVVALAIDPLATEKPATSTPIVAEPPSRAPVPAPPPTAPTPPPASPPREVPPPATPTRLRLLAAAQVSALRLPTAGIAVAIQGGFVHGAFSLAVEGRADFPHSQLAAEGQRGTVSASIVSAALVPCVEGALWFGCVVLGGGALQGSGGDVSRPKRDTTPLVSAGVRAGLQLESDAGWLLRVQTEALAPFTRTTLGLGGAPAWTTPTVALGAGVALGKRF